MNKGCFCLLFGLLPFWLFAQGLSNPVKHELGINYYYGYIPEHNPAIGHLITGHPEGFILSYNRKTFGEEKWHQYYNYPDYGWSFIYQDLKNPYLGNNLGLYIHYNFYFLHRKMLFRVGQGIAYNTNPYDADTNYENIAFGTNLLASTSLLLNYTEKNIFKGFGIQAGIALMHYSNGNLKAPNKSTNTIALNIGLNYLIDAKEKPNYIATKREAFSEPIHLNFILRSGIQTSDVIGSKQYPFYTLGAFADKRVSYKTTIQFGTEVFLSPMLKEFIRYRSIAYPDSGLTGTESSTRVGVFAGYQLNLGKTSIVGNLGYYAYYPYNFEGRVYLRAGFQREIFKNTFIGMSVKSHAAKAEAGELYVGYRL